MNESNSGALGIPESMPPDGGETFIVTLEVTESTVDRVKQIIKKHFYVLCILLGLFLLCGCSYQATPSQYDLKLKTKVKSLEVEVGGMTSSVEITIDSRRYQELSAEQNIFLSYHLRAADGELLEFDGIRTAPEPIDARGIRKEHVTFTAPLEAGNYQLEIDLVEENVTWFSEQGMKTLQIPLHVNATYEPPYKNIILRSEIQHIESSSRDIIRLPIILENSGTVPLYHCGQMETRLSYHLKTASGEILQYDGKRTALATTISGGESYESIVILDDELLYTPGEYLLSIDLVIEGIAWYGNMGMKTLEIPLTVQPLKPRPFSDSLSPNENPVSVLRDSSEALNVTWRLIQQTLNNTASVLVTEENGTPFFGFCAGNQYPQFWVRDDNTTLPASRFFQDKKYLNSWIELHLRYQGADGNIRDWVQNGGSSDKNTVESDQETSLVQAACRYYMWSGDDQWLCKEIEGVSILSRLEAALTYLLENRRDSETGLIVGAHTIDWGDVEIGDETQNAIYMDDDSVRTIDIYDQSMFVLAADGLSKLMEKTGDINKAVYWKSIAEEISQKARQTLWLPEQGYFKICMHLSEYEHSFNEDELFGMGGNITAIQAGIADEAMAASIFDVAAKRQQEYGISTISGSVLPPYPEGAFSHNAVSTPYSYQNGGQWDWFGARLVTAMYELGYTELADQKLEEIAKKICSNKEINEWESPDGIPLGSKNFAGAAGVLAQAIVEGRYGIYLSYDNLCITPHLNMSDGSIFLHDYASGYYVGYSYFNNSYGIRMMIATDFEGSVSFVLPAEISDYRVLCNGIPQEYQLKEKNGMTSLLFSARISDYAEILVIPQ
ncbi:hypothetical protein D5274_16325 [bacterium 1XD42-94]|nr:hypothetical protein [bacterium 1XD42-76]NBK06648.1 hypothetical protein [bacterium 1XD42-94]